ncbi:MAG: hypothetical protein ACT4PU_10400 [Planctomycetota bacterium]
MKLGARSVRGAMGAYTLAGLLLVLTFALVLVFARPEAPSSEVSLPADSSWDSASLDDGRQLVVLQRGERLPVLPGDYRLTLVDSAGQSEVRALSVQAGLTTLR